MPCPRLTKSLPSFYTDRSIGAPEGAGEAEAPPTLAEAAAAARRLMEGGLPPAAAARQAAAGTPYSKGDVYRELIRAQAEDPKK